MSKKQKQLAERRHRTMHRFLVENFPDCEVEYNGVEGFDHHITHNDKTTIAETKSCTNVISDGIDREKMKQSDRRIVFEKPRLGRFKFDRQDVVPYDASQHDDLVACNGWYLFITGEKKGPINIFGMPAKDLKLSGKPNIKKIAWSTILNQCSPKWLEELKRQVYKTDNDEDGYRVHYKPDSCGTVGFNSKLTSNKYEVTCKFCLLRMMNREE